MARPVTWLPVTPTPTPTHHSVLELQPDIWARFCELLFAAQDAADHPLLRLAQLRLAQLMGCSAVLAGADPQQLANLGRWEVSGHFSERERATLAYAEQFHFDQNRLTVEHKAAMARHFSPA